MRHWLFCVLLLAGCGKATSPTAALTAKLAPPAPIPLEVYFVRHGETVSNATGRYTDATLNKLTPLGEAQAKAVAKELADVQFDAAIVSPSLRAEITAAETLREHHLVATIWPEMNECCTQHGKARNEPASYTLKKSGKVHVPSSLGDVLSVDAADDLMFDPGNYADGIVQTRIAGNRFPAYFCHQVKAGEKVYRVLVVGHAAQGSRFLDVLLGRAPIGDIEIKNGSVTVLRREPGGPFTLVKKIANPSSSNTDDAMKTGAKAKS